MRIALALIIALIFGLISPLPSQCKEKKEKPAERPELITSFQKIANGKTFKDQNSENVSFTLSPMKAFIKISF